MPQNASRGSVAEKAQTRLRKIAALRALGFTWAVVAKTLGISEAQAAGTPRAHREQWDRAYAEAETGAVEEAASRALARLVRLLDSADEKVAQSSAASILAHRTRMLGLRAAAVAPAEAGALVFKLVPVQAAGGAGASEGEP